MTITSTTCTSGRCTWMAWAVLPIVFWAAVISCSLWWNIRCLEEGELSTAASVGRSFFKELQVVQLWNARHGGVYVPITEEIQPNPYLRGPNRDVTTLEGLHFTKVNPAMMTRQTSEIARKESNVQYHITSIQAIRPENEADEWEARVLRGLRNENDEIIELDRTAMMYRYMIPVSVEEECLQCHADQGYQVGDIYGGISVSIPAKPYIDAVRTSKNNLISLHITALLMGTGVFLLLQRWHDKQVQLKVQMSCALEQAKTAEILEEQSAVHKAFLTTAQYLAGLSAGQNPWSELGKAIISFFGADFAVFGECGPKGEILLHDWSFSENATHVETVAENIREEMADVIETGFLATRLLHVPKPCAMLSLPMTYNNQTTAVISAGHYRSTPLPRELVNVYLSAAGLAGTMIARLKAEMALTEAHDQLENRVKERTAELFTANKKLRSEITERKRAVEELKLAKEKAESATRAKSEFLASMSHVGWPPHFIWMDIRMPVMDGLKATRRIKASPGGDSIKIVVLTAGALQEEREPIQTAGCDDFVRKPYREPEIFHLMAKHLGIEYLYDEETPEARAEPETVLSTRQLTAFPADLHDALLRAVLELDTPRILEVVDRIIDFDADIGLALKKLAKNLEYNRLLALLEGELG